MKKIILKCTAFLLILLIILAILSKIFVPKNNTRTAGISKSKALATGVLAEPENTIDVLIVGDSESYTSFIPLEAWHKYGYTSYVCGTPAQKLPLTANYIYESLKKQNPKIVMIETNTIYRRAALSSPLEQILMKIFPAIEYHNRWKKLSNQDFFGKVNYTYIQPYKGYYYSTKIKGAKNEEHMEDTKEEKRIPKSNKIYLKTIQQYCKSKGIDLILYSCISKVNWNSAKHNGVEKLAKELDIEYIDLNLMQDKIKIDWEKDTRDKGDHLNHSGAIKTTNILAEYLNTKNLPDHRNDESYKSWDEFYEKYAKKVNNIKK